MTTLGVRLSASLLCTPLVRWSLMERLAGLTLAGAGILRLYGGKDCTKAFLDIHSEAYLTSFLPAGFVGVVAGSGQRAPRALAAALQKTAARPVIDEHSVLLMPRALYSARHEAYRQEFRKFLLAEVWQCS